ncbi:TorF family putative porin [Methylophaga sp.]|uniref:TorF family putative porin n=1 Tax=Methylophaga sp. TaxID=2024840 RepID=UPI0027251BD9|nr:TorF family putative porin [Methylophaga sp.]MDO8826935.1 TorF family putative porin [Methylophaga sp.]
MKFKTLSAMCLAATTVLATSSAMAWESEDGQHSTSASVELASDYVWRGVSQTLNKPAISGSFDYEHASGFYAGTWASNVDFDDDASSEIDIYAGFAGEFGESGIGFDIGVLRYMYPGEATLNWNEVVGSLSYSYFTFGVAHSGDVFGTSETGTYYSLGFDYDLPMDIGFSAGIGYYDFNSSVTESGDPNSYRDYMVGISKEMIGLDFGLTYTSSDSDGKKIFGKRYADDRLILTVGKTF